VASNVDVLIVFYNSSKFIGPLLDSLRAVSIPITAYFLDNASRDGTADELAREIPKLPFRTFLFRTQRNQGFARGINLLSRQGCGDFIFILNPDAELERGCLEKLVAKAESDPTIGIAEARQSPREHPKAVDVSTGETTWCSGAAALIRREAFEAVAGFDEQLFFMYCEDVDLSWKLWLSNWKCLYVRDAVVRHYTQDLIEGKRRTVENYFTFRNSLFLFYRFGPWNGRSVLWSYLWKRLMSPKYTITSKILFVFAFADHIRYIPYLLHTRHTWGNRQHPWIRLEETSLTN
jgi:GT2 family glycosyltransferase